jgi:ketosteroid isomerase-like protein
MSDTPKAPSPPSDEEIRELAETLDVSEDVARVLAGQEALDGTETADGEIVTATAPGPARDTARAMSEENVEVVRRGHEAFQQGDLTAMLELVDPEVVCYVAAPLPDPGEYHGPEGLLRMIANWTEGFDEYVQRAEEYIEAGDHVIAGVYTRATGTQSGVPVESRFWFLHTVRKGKLVRIGVHDTKQQALEAAGLRE